MITDSIQAYAQQHYFFAEDGLVQAINDGANYWYIDGSLVEEYPENWSDERISSLVSQMNASGVKAIYHGNFKLPLSSDVYSVRMAAVNAVLAEVDLSAKLSAPLIIHGGAIVEPRLVVKAKKEALDNYLRSLEIIVSHAEKMGVMVLLENLSNYINYRPFHYIFTTAPEYKYILDRLDSKNVALFFDVGHAAICDGNPAAVIEEFHERIWGMSFSNNDGVRDLHLGIHKGIIDYQKVINTILDVGWQGVLAFEVRGRSFADSIKDVTQLFNNATPRKCA